MEAIAYRLSCVQLTPTRDVEQFVRRGGVRFPFVDRAVWYGIRNRLSSGARDVTSGRPPHAPSTTAWPRLRC